MAKEKKTINGRGGGDGEMEALRERKGWGWVGGCGVQRGLT